MFGCDDLGTNWCAPPEELVDNGEFLIECEIDHGVLRAQWRPKTGSRRCAIAATPSRKSWVWKCWRCSPASRSTAAAARDEELVFIGMKAPKHRGDDLENELNMAYKKRKQEQTDILLHNDGINHQDGRGRN